MADSKIAEIAPGAVSAVRRALAATAEGKRVADNAAGTRDWYAWGPYLSDRQWGTVREDYSADGTAWDYFPHDHARSRAYRWGEDGIGGLSDSQQRLCLAVALWNGKDPILKERLFGLTNGEGNHGEDVKEVYYYLDGTPSHSYLRMLYKYPHHPFPYGDLVETNRRRNRGQREYELIDTGAFDEDRYFDVVIEYAKADVDDIVLKVTAHNRGPDPADLHIVPQLWFRNTWSWSPGAERPRMRLSDRGIIAIDHPDLGDYQLHYDGSARALFTENDSNPRRLWGDSQASGYFKDGINDYLVAGDQHAVNPDNTGTKAAVLHWLAIPPGEHRAVTVRLSPRPLDPPGSQDAVTAAGAADQISSKTSAEPDATADAKPDAETIVAERRAEADAYYAILQHGITEPDHRTIQRQALAGLIWTKQYYYYDVHRWMHGDPGQPKPPARRSRNAEWSHLKNADIISMPDTWEYPWYAAWDLAFHTIPFALIDCHFAKEQLKLMVREWYMHPNGQIPAYEWAFSDVNPPVHAWATWRVFQIDRRQRGSGPGDLAFLESVFHKLMLNFTWWVNRKDREDRNVFQGGFLGLDNIGVFDRSRPLPTGGYINQSDGTSWMAMYCLNMMRIAIELALSNPVYEDLAIKFFEHFLHIARAMTDIASEGLGLWDSEDQFYYDVLTIDHSDSHQHLPLRLRSLVGLIPLFAVETIEPETLRRLPRLGARMDWILDNQPELANLVSRWYEPGRGERRLLSLLRGSRMKKLLSRMLDEDEFLSDYGVRGISKQYQHDPYVFDCDGRLYEVCYDPAESTTTQFGGNSNWRGPIWLPINYLLVESLQKFHHYYSDDFKVECPTGSGTFVTINDVARELTQRLIRIFTRDDSGTRPVYGHCPRMQHDPNFSDHILFYEYFHGDSGRGVGASHQTGWTALIAKLLHPRRSPLP
ncbi:MAG: glucosidase [Myxococcota bacterium]